MHGQTTYAEHLAECFATLELTDVPTAVINIITLDILDVLGLCIAARGTDYIESAINACEEDGDVTAIGHTRRLIAADAAFVNGIAAHGEDFDDTLEGSPVHIGAVVIPAVLAACERDKRTGQDAIRGMIAGCELMCRMSRSVPGGMHKACFHPTAIVGAFGASMGIGVALGLSAQQLTMALGIAGSMSSGIIEYLTEGAWTKRMHAGWAAQSGIRAARLAKHGFTGPRTVFEGEHNAFRAFSPSMTPDYNALTGALGDKWITQDIAFKPYACGTMIHPYIDCMLQLVDAGIRAEEIVDIECKTSELIVHRLWEPLKTKQAPTNAYIAKFSVPYCLAVAYYDRTVGLAQFDEKRIADSQVQALAAKVRYVVDPDNEYPHNYTGHLSVRLRDGLTKTFSQPHFRGGMREPMTRNEIVDKFRHNLSYGKINASHGEQLITLAESMAEQSAPLELPKLG